MEQYVPCKVVVVVYRYMFIDIYKSIYIGSNNEDDHLLEMPIRTVRLNLCKYRKIFVHI